MSMKGKYFKFTGRAGRTHSGYEFTIGKWYQCAVDNPLTDGRAFITAQGHRNGFNTYGSSNAFYFDLDNPSYPRMALL
jgi:hypothetical protein